MQDFQALFFTVLLLPKLPVSDLHVPVINLLGTDSLLSGFHPWVERAHNSPTSSTTGLSPLQFGYGYEPPLFKALQEISFSQHLFCSLF